MKNRVEELVAHCEQLLDAFLGLSGKVAIFLPMDSDQRVVVIHAAGQGSEGFKILSACLLMNGSMRA